jgi:hypothetical protein
LLSDVGESLFEDNIITDGLMPGIEFNGGFCANALFGNYLTNNVIDVDCHNTHPMMNLWEQNDIAGYFEMDGYFGSASHQTLFRNSIRSPYMPILFKRWTTYMNVVGNVLGSPGSSYSSYASEVNGAGSMIFQLGFPNIGNNSYDGTTSPPVAWNYPGSSFSDAYGVTRSNGIFTFTNTQVNTTNLVGNFTNIPAPIPGVYSLVFQDRINTNLYYPTNGVPVTAYAAGTSSNLLLSAPITVSNGWKVYLTGQNAYQQLQSSNKYTHLITGNYDYFNKSVTWDANGSQVLPASLLYTNGPPPWWGTNRWPALGSDLAPLASMLPAQERFLGIPVGLTQRTSSPQNLRITGTSQ